VIVFSEEEFEGVDVDSIDIGSTGSLLSMVMLVNVAVDGLDVQCPVQWCVKEVIDEE